MQIKLQTILFEEGKRAVLLLHGFTGNSADVETIRSLSSETGLSSYAPNMKGMQHARRKFKI